jgi:hypothetical protein
LILHEIRRHYHHVAVDGVVDPPLLHMWDEGRPRRLRSRVPKGVQET